MSFPSWFSSVSGFSPLPLKKNKYLPVFKKTEQTPSFVSHHSLKKASQLNTVNPIWEGRSGVYKKICVWNVNSERHVNCWITRRRRMTQHRCNQGWTSRWSSILQGGLRHAFLSRNMYIFAAYTCKTAVLLPFVACLAQRFTLQKACEALHRYATKAIFSAALGWRFRGMRFLVIRAYDVSFGMFVTQRELVDMTQTSRFMFLYVHGIVNSFVQCRSRILSKNMFRNFSRGCLSNKPIW